MRSVILVHLDKPEEAMPFTHLKDPLPKYIRLFSMLETPINIKYYQKIDIIKNGLTVYQQLDHKPSDAFAIE